MISQEVSLQSRGSWSKVHETPPGSNGKLPLLLLLLRFSPVLLVLLL